MTAMRAFLHAFAKEFWPRLFWATAATQVLLAVNYIFFPVTVI